MSSSRPQRAVTAIRLTRARGMLRAPLAAEPCAAARWAGECSMSRRVLLLRATIPLLLAVSLLAPAAASPVRAEAATRCPTGTITFDNLARLARDRGPLANRFPPAVAGVYERAYACLGSRTLRFRAFIADPGGVGGASAYRMTPRWMLDAGVFLFGTSRRVDGLVDGPAVMAAVPPRLGTVASRFRDRWVVVTGRFGDPVARTCRAVRVKGETPNRSQAVRICRSVFVVSSVASLDAPATSTVPAARVGGAPAVPGGLWLAALAGGLAGLLLTGRRRRG